MYFTLSRNRENSWSRGQKFTLQPLFLDIGSGVSCLFWQRHSCMHRDPGSTGGAESLSFILFWNLVVTVLFWEAEAVSLNPFRLRRGCITPCMSSVMQEVTDNSSVRVLNGNGSGCCALCCMRRGFESNQVAKRTKFSSFCWSHLWKVDSGSCYKVKIHCSGRQLPTKEDSMLWIPKRVQAPYVQVMQTTEIYRGNKLSDPLVSYITSWITPEVQYSVFGNRELSNGENWVSLLVVGEPGHLRINLFIGEIRSLRFYRSPCVPFVVKGDK